MKNLIVASHRRSGTHITIDSITNNYIGYNSKAYLNIDRLIPGHAQPLTLAELKEETKDGGLVIKTHMLPDPSLYFSDKETIDTLNNLFQQSNIIYVVRNGLDVMVSLYYYMRVYDAAVKKMDFTEFLKSGNNFDPIQNMSRTAFWAYHHQQWSNSAYSKSTINISFEDWLKDYKGTIQKINKAFSLKNNKHIVNVLVSDQQGIIERIRKFFGKPDVKRTSISFRKGTTGESKSYIGAAEIEAIDKGAIALMQKLGYEMPAV